MTLIPTQVTFRGLAHSDALEADIRKRIAWLEQFYAGIVGCRVLVEMPHRHRHDGRHFHVRIEVTVPGGAPIVVSHEPSLHGPLKDVEEAAHRKETEGEIAEISKGDGYGFIQADGRQIYFSRASVLDDAFDQLVVGTPVAFVEEQGEKGPQALFQTRASAVSAVRAAATTGRGFGRVVGGRCSGARLCAKRRGHSARDRIRTAGGGDDSRGGRRLHTATD